MGSKGESNPLGEEDRVRWVEARKKWLEVEEKNLAMARQRAKIKWLKEGDENTKFCHATCRNRERKNALIGLNIDSEWTEDPKIIKEYVFEIFKTKFARGNDTLPKLSLESLNKLLEEEATSLERRFSEEEVLGSIKECGKNKSSGPDGFTIGFIKKF